MSKMVMAAFENRDKADMAIQELEKIGCQQEDLSIITKADKNRIESNGEESTDAGEAAKDVVGGATGGATTGGMIGGLAGLLAGAGIFPALAGLFIGGPVAAALGLTGIAASAISGAVTGAAAGGLVGALTGLGVSTQQAEAYNDVVEEGGLIIGVPADWDQIAEAREILERNGGMDIQEFELKATA